MNKSMGLDAIIQNLNREISNIEGDVQKGLTLGMLKIKGDSMSGTPVDTGNLRGSHYLVAKDGTVNNEGRGSGFDTSDESGKRVANEHTSHVEEARAGATFNRMPFAEIGCTAFYAEKVHEDLEAQHVTGHAKFMENALRGNQEQLISSIKRFAKR